MQRNESASQRSGSLAARQWSGVETAGIGGVRLFPAAAVCGFASEGSRSSKGHSLTLLLPNRDGNERHGVIPKNINYLHGDGVASGLGVGMAGGRQFQIA